MHAVPSENENAVLNVLSTAKVPMSAYDILHALRDRQISTIKAPVQVYRALDRLVKGGDVHRVAALNAFVRCSGAHHDTPPGLLVCTACGTVAEFDATAATKATGKSGFALVTAAVEVSGTCMPCQLKAKAS